MKKRPTAAMRNLLEFIADEERPQNWCISCGSWTDGTRPSGYWLCGLFVPPENRASRNSIMQNTFCNNDLSEVDTDEKLREMAREVLA